MGIEDDDFEFFAGFLYRKSGYQLTAEKKYLLESRLTDVVRLHKLENERALANALRSNEGSKLAEEVVESMTVNETFFFRDQTPFETFEQKMLPKLAEWQETRPFRIWSAAASTGQEAYSLAMVIEDNHAKYPNADYEIIATDINNAVLEHGRRGVYSDLEIGRGLSDRHREKFFSREGNGWKVTQNVQKHVTFRQLNLCGHYDIPGLFDFILLRNVLIYFDAEMKEQVLLNVSRKLHPGGYLLLGAAEGIYDPDHFFQRCDEIKGLYRFTDQNARQRSATG